MNMHKQQLRERALQARASITSDERALWDMMIFERAHKIRAFQLAERVHLYRSFRDEVPTDHFFEYAWGIGKEIYVPCVVPGSLELRHARVTRDTQWHAGPFGVLEPNVAASTLVASSDDRWNAQCAIIVPLVAFDLHGHRLGYGKGYYDRFLRETTSVSIGLAYECQKQPTVFAEPHDHPLTCIVTEQRTYVSPS